MVSDGFDGFNGFFDMVCNKNYGNIYNHYNHNEYNIDAVHGDIDNRNNMYHLKNINELGR